MSLYNKGIERLHAITVKDINPLEEVYKNERRAGCETTSNGDKGRILGSLQRAVEICHL